MEIAAVILALAYLLLAMRQNRWCWPAGAASALLYLGVFAQAGLYLIAGLQLFYVAMSAYGWWQWRPDAAASHAGIRRWPWRQHAMAVLGIAALTVSSGTLLQRWTDAAAPYPDAFTTWASILTTWMVAQKLLENWLYWFVIDAVSLALALAQQLYPTAALFAVYLVLVVLGDRAWRRALEAS